MTWINVEMQLKWSHETQLKTSSMANMPGIIIETRTWVTCSKWQLLIPNTWTPFQYPIRRPCCKISQGIEAARLLFRIIRSLWNLAGTSAAVLPISLSNFKALKKLKSPISRLRDFTSSYYKCLIRYRNGTQLIRGNIIKAALPLTSNGEIIEWVGHSSVSTEVIVFEIWHNHTYFATNTIALVTSLVYMTIIFRGDKSLWPCCICARFLSIGGLVLSQWQVSYM